MPPASEPGVAKGEFGANDSRSLGRSMSLQRRAMPCQPWASPGLRPACLTFRLSSRLSVAHHHRLNACFLVSLLPSSHGLTEAERRNVQFKEAAHTDRKRARDTRVHVTASLRNQQVRRSQNSFAGGVEAPDLAVWARSKRPGTGHQPVSKPLRLLTRDDERNVLTSGSDSTWRRLVIRQSSPRETWVISLHPIHVHRTRHYRAAHGRASRREPGAAQQQLILTRSHNAIAPSLLPRRPDRNAHDWYP